MKKVKILALFILIVAAIWYFRTNEPGSSGLFLACPIKLLSGYDCPGCGSQRAAHHLINFEFSKAFSMNPLLICSIPYVFFGFMYTRIGLPEDLVFKLRKHLYGGFMVYVWIVVIVAFTVWRNWNN